MGLGGWAREHWQTAMGWGGVVRMEAPEGSVRGKQDHLLGCVPTCYHQAVLVMVANMIVMPRKRRGLGDKECTGGTVYL